MSQYFGIIFKVAMLDGWLVVFTGPKLIDELRRGPDDDLTSVEGTAEVRSPRRPLHNRADAHTVCGNHDGYYSCRTR